ncbi:hypothetical protein [Methylomarinovum caldicuralii]|uniref:hypothetical protein n=1 Tax=Methylomarinovum caldicuralii TaxID=438856 RepID=UPI00295502F0|nr:hypothetical protein [Methylomarinovum caldicuralii]
MQAIDLKVVIWDGQNFYNLKKGKEMRCLAAIFSKLFTKFSTDSVENRAAFGTGVILGLSTMRFQQTAAIFLCISLI